MTTALMLTAAAGVATVTLSRPQAHNALDEGLIAEIARAFQKLSADDTVRVVVLTGAGKSFCAGADLGWMQRSGALPQADNQRDAMALAMMLDAIDRCPKPVVAVVNGPAYGGGVGLVAAADIAIASEEAAFSLTEVKLGIIPAVIGPYMVEAIGARACRRYMLSAERFDAREAHRLGLVHAVVTADKLEHAQTLMVEQLLKGGPKAQSAVKDLLKVVGDSPMGPDTMRYTANRIAELRASEEGQEGLAAFFEKRKPKWCE
jgi:methylglutaconyl-CoA hydratase